MRRNQETQRINPRNELSLGGKGKGKGGRKEKGQNRPLSSMGGKNIKKKTRNEGGETYRKALSGVIT